jgi:hypothetical protein
MFKNPKPVNPKPANHSLIQSLIEKWHIKKE